MAFESQFIPVSELQDFLAEARKRYAYGLEVDHEDREEAKEDARFELGGLNQWDKAAIDARSDPKYPRPILTENRIHVFAQQVINDGRQSKPSVVITAGDRGDPKTAEVIQSWIRQIEYDSDADIAYDTAREHQVVSGRGWYRITTQFATRRPSKSGGDLQAQVPRFEPINNQFSIVWDPSAKRYDKADADWLFCVGVISKDTHKRKYGKSDMNSGASFVPADGAETWVGLGPHNEDLLEVEYWKRTHTPRVLCELQSGAIVWQDEIQPAGQVAPGGAIYDEDPIVDQRVEDFITVQQFILDAEGIRGETEWTCEEVPFIPVFGIEKIVDGKARRSGLIRPGKTPQRLINLTVSNIAELTAQIPKSPYMLAEGQAVNHEDEWETINTIPRAYIQYKQVGLGGSFAPPPQRIISEPPIQALIALLNQSTDALKASMGIFDASLGAQSNETAGIAIESRKREADNCNFHFHDNEERSRKSAGRKLLELLANLNQGVTVVAIRSVDGKTKQVPINQEYQDEDGKNLIHVIDPDAYGVSVSSGPSYSSARRESFGKMTQMAQAWPQLLQVGGDIVLRNSDMPGAEDLADRIEKTLPPGLAPKKEGEPAPLAPEVQQMMEQGKQTITQLTQTVHELQDQLDSKQPDIAARIKIAQINAETARLQIQAELDIARLNAGVKTAINEMQADMAGLKHSIDTAHSDTELSVQTAQADADRQASLAGTPPLPGGAAPEPGASESEQGETA